MNKRKKKKTSFPCFKVTLNFYRHKGDKLGLYGGTGIHGYQ